MPLLLMLTLLICRYADGEAAIRATLRRALLRAPLMMLLLTLSGMLMIHTRATRVDSA